MGKEQEEIEVLEIKGDEAEAIHDDANPAGVTQYWIFRFVILFFLA